LCGGMIKGKKDLFFYSVSYNSRVAFFVNLAHFLDGYHCSTI
jgi:hypothetical protein